MVGVVLAVSLSAAARRLADVPRSVAKLPGAAEVQALFNGIPQAANTLGPASAPVTMVEYIDLQCPYCREFESTVLPKLVRTYVRPGKVRIEQKLLAFIGPDSVRGRSAALAAGMQNKQFNFSEILYLNQGTENTGWLDENMVDGGREHPGPAGPATACRRQVSPVSSTEKAIDDEAQAAGITRRPRSSSGRPATPVRVQVSSPRRLPGRSRPRSTARA